MIQIESIAITEFRGIRDLVLDLKKNSFGISGPNGTGKSGIVDAIEFALTGNITRLGGAGTKELSVKSHAPHVDCATKPEKAVVKLTAFLPAKNKTFTIERSVKNASAPKLTPDDADTQEALAKLSSHPEFALSRREIVKYIITPAGDRNKDVQVLLRLNQIDTVRLALQRVANDTRRECEAAQFADSEAKRDFLQHLGIQSATMEELLAAVNQRRAVLKLDPLTEWKRDTSLKSGVVAGSDKVDPQPQQRVTKAAATQELHQYAEAATALASDEVQKAILGVENAMDSLTSDPEILKGFRQKVLVEQGIELIDDEACPLCDTTWKIEDLTAHLRQKLERASTATSILEDLEKASQPIIRALAAYGVSAQKMVLLCQQGDTKIDPKALVDFAAQCVSDKELLGNVSRDPSLIANVREILARKVATVPEAVHGLGESIGAFVGTLPEPSVEEAAKEYLIVAQVKFETCQKTRQTLEAAKIRMETAARVSTEYGEVSTKALEEIYDKVQKDFATYYSFLNRDDEEKFEGKLTPSVGKLAFDVDFYGRGKFPPGAYHSEGHQDGMGLCLYLALVKHTLGDDFVLAVLDDVLMSVDAGHRREVCELLKTHFPKTQFVLTTHDPVWLEFMKGAKLIQKSVNFGGWSVETGPQVWRDGEVWQKIEDKLKQNDVSGAAAMLRRYLEFISTILAEKLHAKVHFHANGSYDLGDLWPAVIAAWKERLNEAKETAQSWGAPTKDIESLQADTKAKIAATNAEQWMVNKAVHFNQWHTLTAVEFRTVADAFEAMLASMQCTAGNCGTYLEVSPPRGTNRDALRCACGQRNYNLKNKKAA